MGYGEVLKKNWLSYLLEVVVAVILINWDLKIFLIIAFLTISLEISVQLTFLKKVIRVFQVYNETKLIAIIKKLKITNKEIADIFEETKLNTSEEDWTSLEKDFRDIQLKT